MKFTVKNKNLVIFVALLFCFSFEVNSYSAKKIVISGWGSSTMYHMRHSLNSFFKRYEFIYIDRSIPGQFSKDTFSSIYSMIINGKEIDHFGGDKESLNEVIRVNKCEKKVIIISTGKNDLLKGNKSVEKLITEYKKANELLSQEGWIVFVVGIYKNPGTKGNSKLASRIDSFNYKLSSFFGGNYISLEDFILDEDSWLKINIIKKEIDIKNINQRNLAPSLSKDGVHLRNDVSEAFVNQVVGPFIIKKSNDIKLCNAS